MKYLSHNTQGGQTSGGGSTERPSTDTGDRVIKEDTKPKK